jgi:sugar/nucleoside kinase (ribokinase family)
MAMPGRCIIVGDVMMDVTARIDSDIAYASDTPAHVTLQPGGVAANTSAWMAADGKEVTIVGCVGDDAFGHAIRLELEALGVDVRLQQSTTLPTGTCVVVVDRRRERTMFPDSGANADLTVGLLRDLITADCHVHVSGYTLLNPATRHVGLAVLDLAEEAGATRSLDPASAAPMRAQLPLFRSLLPRVHVLLANEDEATVLTGTDDPHDALERLADLVPVVIVKVGARGVLARDGAITVTAPAHHQEVVDTTGAGDAFTAGFLPAWRAGAALAVAVEEGQRLASAAVGRVGASPMVR